MLMDTDQSDVLNHRLCVAAEDNPAGGLGDIRDRLGRSPLLVGNKCEVMVMMRRQEEL